MGRNVLVAIVVVIIIAAAAGFFLLAPKNKSNTDKGALSPSPTSTTGGRHTAVSEITVETSEYTFSPSTLIAVAGKKLTVTVKNSGKMAHDFSIEELNAKTKLLQPGQSETITVTPPKAGMYLITCTVPGHLA